MGGRKGSPGLVLAAALLMAVLPSADGQADGPDLVVDSVAVAAGRSCPDGSALLSGHVWNAGTGDAGSFTVRFYVDGLLLEEGAMMLPTDGQSTTAGSCWKATTGRHTASIAADARNEVAETREDNNEAGISFAWDGSTASASTSSSPATSSSSSATTSAALVGTTAVVVPGIKVERKGDANVVTWASDRAGAEGFQVWRSNSPYALLATLDGTTYTDSSLDARPGSRYLVTAFTGATLQEGFFPPGTAPDETAYPGVAPRRSPDWAFAFGALGLAGVAGAGAYAVRRNRRRVHTGKQSGAPAGTEAASSGRQADVLAVHDIRVVRGSKVLVDGISLRIGAGRTTLLFGPSGSGKSLLLKSIVGLVEHSGSAYDLAKGATVPLGKEAFGYVPQDIQLYPTLSAMENVLYFAGQFGIPRKKGKETGMGLLRDLGLGDQADQELQKLSGGQQRRVSVAAALVHQPRILIMDEPSSGLDFSARRTLWELLRTLAETRGIAVVASTHFIDEADYASEVGIVHKGRLVAHGPMESLVRTLPGHGRCVEITFDTLGAADNETLRRLLPQLQKAELASMASYRLYSVRYYAKAPTVAMAKLPGLLRAAGLSARSSSLEDIGLDDVFTFLTGDALPGDRT